ncbi:MAG: hypothetical protein U5Q03_06240 [Bacteroidota bacterium]|nr:hypothetical protein [Bacteroidota bacterium]
MRILILSFLLVLAAGASGQKLSKYYRTSNLENGKIYFVKSFEDFESSKGRDAFIYDLTYLKGSDTLTINYTYYAEEAFEADSIGIQFNKQITFFPTERLFIERNKKSWEHRYTAEVPLEFMVDFYDSENSPFFQLQSGGKSLVYEIRNNKWEKFSGIMQQIFQVIELNR